MSWMSTRHQKTPQKATTAIAFSHRNERFADRSFAGPWFSV
jgi:hypothetical protein